MAIYRLRNKIRNYQWGSAILMEKYFGIHSDDNKPLAEMWMGAHPGASSEITVDGCDKKLEKAISDDPEYFLGPSAAEKFSGKLPFLFKVLSAGEPLSIQAHPDKKQAADGFRRENRKEIALNDPARNYKDNNHKPEIICAVSEFHAMRGFRKSEEIIKYLKSINNPVLNDLSGILENEGGYRDFFNSLMSLNDQSKAMVIEDVEKWASLKDNYVKEWVSELINKYPADIAVISPVYLNLVKLDPGQAMFLDAGELHAYLSGIGIELMANSDNVLRGGLTVKNVDLDELENILKYNVCIPEILNAETGKDIWYYFNTGADEFRLSKIILDEKIEKKGLKSPLIMVCQQGNAEIIQGGSRTDIGRGDSVFISPMDESVKLIGRGIFYGADIPLGKEKI